MRPTRLNAGDWINAAASLALIVVIFAFPWFGFPSNFKLELNSFGLSADANGWQTFTVIGPLGVIVAGLGLSACYLTATRRSPALGVLTMIVQAPLSGLMLLWTLFDVVVSPPSLHVNIANLSATVAAKPAAYVGLALTALIPITIYGSFRYEGNSGSEQAPEVKTLPVT